MMTDQAAITHAIAQVAVEAVKAAVQTMAVALDKSSSGFRSEETSMGPILGGPALK